MGEKGLIHNGIILHTWAAPKPQPQENMFSLFHSELGGKKIYIVVNMKRLEGFFSIKNSEVFFFFEF